MGVWVSWWYEMNVVLMWSVKVEYVCAGMCGGSWPLECVIWTCCCYGCAIGVMLVYGCGVWIWVWVCCMCMRGVCMCGFVVCGCMAGGCGLVEHGVGNSGCKGVAFTAGRGCIRSLHVMYVSVRC